MNNKIQVLDSRMCQTDKFIKRMIKDAKVTSFQKGVYQEVLSIPLGQVRTYRWVARKVNRPKAVRAVANALKNNPFPLLIPCHRVVRQDRNLGGYNWGGSQKKKEILEIEKKLAVSCNNGLQK